MHANSIVNVSGLINKRGLTAFQITIVVLCFLMVGIDGFDTASIGFLAPAISSADSTFVWIWPVWPDVRSILVRAACRQMGSKNNPSLLRVLFRGGECRCRILNFAIDAYHAAISDGCRPWRR